jgi:hypothetical protein
MPYRDSPEARITALELELERERARHDAELQIERAKADQQRQLFHAQLEQERAASEARRQVDGEVRSQQAAAAIAHAETERDVAAARLRANEQMVEKLRRRIGDLEEEIAALLESAAAAVALYQAKIAKMRAGLSAHTVDVGQAEARRVELTRNLAASHGDERAQLEAQQALAIHLLTAFKGASDADRHELARLEAALERCRSR